MMQRRNLLLACSLAGCLPHFAWAESLMGTKGRPIRIFVPYSAGGPVDWMARLLAELLQKKYGIVLVENRPGAGGQIAMQYVKRQKPDGRSLIIGAVATQAILPALRARLQYHPQKDYQPIAFLGATPNVLLITERRAQRRGIHSYQDFLVWARKQEKLNYASGSMGSIGHFASSYLAQENHLQWQHIAYPGAAQALVSVYSGETDFIIDNLANAKAMIQAHKMRPLALTSARRSPLFPRVATFAESGSKLPALTTWMTLLSPAGIDRKLMRALHKDVTRILQAPEQQKKLQNLAIQTHDIALDDLLTWRETEREKYQVLAKHLIASH